MRLIFWQNNFSFHQQSYIRSLSKTQNVVWVAEKNMDRPETEGAKFDPGNADIVGSPSPQVIQHLISESPNDSLHIFTGISGFAFVKSAFDLCLKTSAKMAVLTENRDRPDCIKGALRSLSYRFEYLKYGSRIGFLLVQGYENPYGGRDWFHKKAGYPLEKIFPFAYFPDIPSSIDLAPSANGPVRVVFLGQHIVRKGGDLLLKALAEFKELKWKAQFIGDGVERENWILLAKELNIDNRVDFVKGKVNTEAMQMIASSDVLVLPSRFDGWGAVVNEALLRGIPVICSDRCGAKDLLQEEWRGHIFKSEDVEALTNALRPHLAFKRSPEMTKHISEWSNCISGDAAAGYLLQIIDNVYHKAPNPIAPWLK